MKEDSEPEISPIIDGDAPNESPLVAEEPELRPEAPKPEAPEDEAPTAPIAAEVADAPGAPDMPDAPAEPQADAAPDVTTPAPEVPEAPEELVAPETPGEPGEMDVSLEPEPKHSKLPMILGIVLGVVFVASVAVCIAFMPPKLDERPVVEPDNPEIEDEREDNPLAISGNDLDDFDLFFLKQELAEKNIVYSPLSIKYALSMLDEGADGETREQIESILGEYHFKNYQNSDHLSLANAFFIRDSKKSLVKESYTTNLATSYNAEVIFDDFASPANVNKWVEDKTFGLVKDLIDELNGDDDYIILNALAIDMEWKNKIQHPVDDFSEPYGGFGSRAYPYSVNFAHTNFHNGVSGFETDGASLDFGVHKVSSAELAATANRYDIVAELGEDNIRKTVQDDYDKWAQEQPVDEVCTAEVIASQAPDLDAYVSELDANYGHISSSTDFRFLDDDNVKIFAKELKEYDGTTLEYVGIMPKNTSLGDFVKNTSAKDINSIIGNLKSIALDSFQDGVVTKLTASIPLFDFDYDLGLKDDLLALGITDVFDAGKSDLSGISDAGAWLNDALHKANIDFSNSGIKAAAATALIGGLGSAAECSWRYNFEVPVVELDLTFDQPYMFLIRDVDSGEVWFTGAVYEPTEYVSPYN